jgi:hypothetical protein
MSRKRAKMPEVKSSRIGFMEGKYAIPDDFDEMFQKEIEEMFYGFDDVDGQELTPNSPLL